MRKFGLLFIVICMIMVMVTGCHETKQPIPVVDSDSIMQEELIYETDSTVYGTCGEATAMHTLQLITDGGDTLSYTMMVEEDADVQGGLLVGDRMAVIGKYTHREELFPRRALLLPAHPAGLPQNGAAFSAAGS